MRLTVALEGNGEGRVLTSIDMQEIAKMTITDDIEKSNFNPQMFHSCTDSAYECGYNQGYAQCKADITNIIETLRDPRNKYTEHRRWNAALDKVLEVINE